ncbi:MAG TPA: hypothetical protein VE986_03405, partial [Hyphomicrobiales bacterium]|nr:hypothetical protein [Hyphomicrobiales bacterium]
MRYKLLTSALFIACIGAISPALLAQNEPPQIAGQVNPETKQLAKGLIEQFLQATHAADVFAGLRRTVKDVYIPTLKDLVQGNVPGAPQPDAKAAAAMAKLLTFLTYASKAGDELDVALAEN